MTKSDIKSSSNQVQDFSYKIRFQRFYQFHSEHSLLSNLS